MCHFPSGALAERGQLTALSAGIRGYHAEPKFHGPPVDVVSAAATVDVTC